MKRDAQLCFRFWKPACLLAALASLTGCKLPPRESWGIIQRDGLINYWRNDYPSPYQSNRYLRSDGRPLMAARSSAQVPYRPDTMQSRYLGERPVPAPQTAPEPRIYPTRPSAASRRSESPVREKSLSQEAAPQTSRIPVEGEPRTSPAPAAALKPSLDALPYGVPVPGRPGMVNSPFAQKQQLVDVTGMAVGEAVKDPYSGKLFRVPPMPQASAAPWSPMSASPAPTKNETPPTAKP